jgi:hypothetical protein
LRDPFAYQPSVFLRFRFVSGVAVPQGERRRRLVAERLRDDRDGGRPRDAGGHGFAGAHLAGLVDDRTGSARPRLAERHRIP